MVQAYILIQTEVGKAALVARSIADIKGVTQAEDVTGPYDVIVRAEARNVDELGKLVVAWGEPAVVLRCGVPRPAEFVAGAPNVVAVNGVSWFVQERGARNLWTVVDRPVYVEVSVPRELASTPIPPLSDAVHAALKALPLRPAR